MYLFETFYLIYVYTFIRHYLFTVSPVQQFYTFKESAKQELNRNNLAGAHQYYNAALSFFDQPFVPSHIIHEHPIILCNRSHVCYRQRLYQQSEHDALAAISICPTYVKVTNSLKMIKFNILRPKKGTSRIQTSCETDLSMVLSGSLKFKETNTFMKH